MAVAIKILLSVSLFLCLLDMPYGFYQFVRFVALIGFAALAYLSFENGARREGIVYVCLAILFQPLIKIALGRDIWNILDVIVGIGLMTSIFLSPDVKPLSNN